MTELPYRPNVGAVLFNRDGKVFVARRGDQVRLVIFRRGLRLPVVYHAIDFRFCDKGPMHAHEA